MSCSVLHHDFQQLCIKFTMDAAPSFHFFVYHLFSFISYQFSLPFLFLINNYLLFPSLYINFNLLYFLFLSLYFPRCGTRPKMICYHLNAAAKHKEMVASHILNCNHLLFDTPLNYLLSQHPGVNFFGSLWKPEKCKLLDLW